MTIIGVSALQPEAILEDDFLASLASSSGKSPAFSRPQRSRRSVLPPEYLTASANRNLDKAFGAVSMSTAQVAADACRAVLAESGIALESVGLLLGECATPFETIPCEAHRIARELSLKIPSYDLAAGCSSFTAALDMLLKRKRRSLPEYILWSSVNFPTTRVDYSRGEEGRIFGDAAAAVLFSTKEEQRGLRVVGSGLGTFPRREPNCSGNSLFTLGLFEHISLQAEAEKNYQWMLEHALKVAPAKVTGTRRIFNDIYPELALRYGSPANSQQAGYSLGTSVLLNLRQVWSEMEAGSSLEIVTVGSGNMFGWANCVGLGRSQC